MHNINYIRENPVEFNNFMRARGEKSIANKIISICLNIITLVIINFFSFATNF